MALQNSDDLRNRIRGAEPPKGGESKPRVIDDFRSGQQRHFPSVGTTLPSHRPSRAAAPAAAREVPDMRSRAPRPSLSVTTQLAPVASAPQPTMSQSAQIPAAAAETLRGPSARPLLPKRTKRRRNVFTVKRIILTVILLLLVGAGLYGYRLVGNLQKVFPGGSVFSVLTTAKLKGEDTGRVNILLAGNSADDPFHDGANLTDSIMIVSIDVRNHTAFMISVPRDLWVAIPGYGHAKINETYYDGQNGNFSAAGYAKGGMGLLAEVLYEDLGVKANYYALVDYSALRDAVNAVGGVDFVVKSEDPRGLYDPSIDFATHGPLVNLSNGTHHLSGQQALDLARSRGDSYGSYGFARSDFDRTANQRQLILALKGKILTAGTFANPVTIANLFDTIGKHVRTDFSLSEVRRLYDIGKDINDKSIQSVGLNDYQGKDYLANYLSPVHSSALIPAAGVDNYNDIKALIRRLLSSNPVVREGARVVVLNGSSASGVAAKAETTLTAKGMTVTAIGDAKATQATTTIIDASGGKMPVTLGTLKQVYTGARVSTANPYADLYDADFIVIIGKDHAGTTAATTNP